MVSRHLQEIPAEEEELDVANFTAVSKAFKICDIAGGVAVAREASRSIQTLFLNALEDVEQMREFLTENMKHTTSPLTTTLDDLANSLDYEARGLPSNMTTLDAGLAWADDRPDRRVERIVGLLEDPPVGDKSSDLAMVDVLSSMLPWIVDRRSKEDYWWKEHQSGRSEGQAKPTLFFDQLYLAAYAVTWGNAACYYPPMTAFVPRGFNLNDVLGPHASFKNDSAVQPTLPENNPNKLAVIGTPYADRANPGLSIVSALAPIYYTGSFYGFDNYNDTNLGLTAIDISIASISSLLHRLDGTVTENSFGLVVDHDFNVYIITQDCVNLIYPVRTGFEESRVHRDESGFGEIVDDRRNQTYLVSDTILQPPTNLTNADWKGLHQEILQHPPGYRGTTQLDIILTGDDVPTPFYVMYEKWSVVGNLTLLVFAPQEMVDNAIDCDFETSDFQLESLVGTQGFRDDMVFQNKGLLDVTLRLGNVPHWVQLEEDGPFSEGNSNNHLGVVHLAAGQELVIPFTATTKGLPVGLTSSLLTLFAEDDAYPDCFYSHVYSLTMTIQVRTQQDLHQLESFRIFGFVIAAIIMLTSILSFGFAVLNSSNAIIKASQPVFLHMLNVGTFVLGTSLIPLSIDDSLVSADGCDVACVAFPWLFCLGFSIAFAAIFSKVWRVHRLLTAASSMQRRSITVQDVMIPFCVIFTLNVVLLFAWTLVAPLEWSRVEQNDGQNSHGTCWHDMSAAQITFLALLTVVNLVALVLANIQAYRARNIADEFSESRYIFLANFGMLQVMMIGTPVMFLVTDNPRAFYFVLCSLVFAIAWPLQLLIFAPKFIYVWNHNHQDADSRVAAAVRKSTRHLSGKSSEFASGGVSRDFSPGAPVPQTGAIPPASSKTSGTDTH
jgi:7 transmembrane sweet-taste receptor of 3 GCPR